MRPRCLGVERQGRGAEVKERMCRLIAAEPAGGFVRKALGRELGLRESVCNREHALPRCQQRIVLLADSGSDLSHSWEARKRAALASAQLE